MIFLRLANDSDLPLMMAWRSNPLYYEGTYSTKCPLTWEEHLSWWKDRNQDWRIFIIELLENDYLRPIGTVNIVQLDNWNPEMGIYIGEIPLWGQGYGKEALAEALEWLRSRGFTATHTTILDSNKRAINLFKSLGFHKACEARKGESRYEIRL